MPKAYFEPENLNALVEVFTEAKRRLNSNDFNDPAKLDLIAHRILSLASDGMPPWMILREIKAQIEPGKGLQDQQEVVVRGSINPDDADPGLG